MFARRIPRLHEEVIDVRLIDGTDRGVGVGVGGQQGTLRVRINLSCGLQKPDSIHARHALICQQQCDPVIANFQPLQQIERALRRLTADYAVVRAVMRAQIAFDGAQNICVIIHCKQYRFSHNALGVGSECLN